ncbi:Uma2 family endonuclease [Enterovirga aerilata]|uniref:Uma2 family endonuclease n=1 Tax=Enterovirga aerilata TaxID=2730920 RepID=UPI001FED3A87|nr:Uma2 family endonuclease [Enterovirga sp. DB1703]
MAPQIERHQRIQQNLWRALDDLAAKRGCVALAGLRLLSGAVEDYVAIPDLVVRCGPPLESGYAKDPVLVAEVLSPSTSRFTGPSWHFQRSAAQSRSPRSTPT